MKVTLGEKGIGKTWQGDFGATDKCVCGGEMRIAFVAHEGFEDDDKGPFVCQMHKNEGVNKGFWPHDCIAVAVYFCRRCFATKALWNQG